MTSATSHRRASSSVRLTGIWLLAARTAWIVTAVVLVVLDIVGTPTLFHLMHVGCDGDQCLNLQLSTARMSRFLASGLSRTFFAVYTTALYWVGILVYATIAAVIFWRRSDDRMALFGSFALLVFGAGLVFGTTKGLTYSDSSWMAVTNLIDLVGTVSFYVFFCLFPSGRFVPRWMRWAVLTLVASQLLAPVPFAPLQAVINSTVVFVVLYGLLVAAQVYRYRRVSNETERQQTKWVVLGFAAGLGGFLVFLGFTNVAESADWGSAAAAILVTDAALAVPLWLIPVSIAIAILRSRLFDIDLVINRTLVYGSLTALLAAVYFACVLGAQAITEKVTGQTKPQPVIVVASTLLIAALFTPLRRRIQATIDRRFYRRKYDAAQALAEFAATVRNEVELSELRERLTSVVVETMQPEHVSLWLRQPESSGR